MNPWWWWWLCNHNDNDFKWHKSSQWLNTVFVPMNRFTHHMCTIEIWRFMKPDGARTIFLKQTFQFLFCLFDLWWSSYLCVCVVTFDIVDQDHHQCIHFCLQIISCFTWLNLLLLLLLKKNISKFILFIRFTVIVCLIKFFGFWFFFMQKKTDKIQYRTIVLSMWEKNLLIIIIVVDDDDDGFILRPFSTIYNE